MNPSRVFAFLLALLIPTFITLEVRGEDMIVYIGTYTGPKSKGIYMTRLDPARGTLSAPEVAAELKNPSFLAIHPNQNYLYAIGEVDEFKGQKAGGITAFAIDPASGKLNQLNQQITGGPGPAFVGVDPSGKIAMVANYGGGSVESLPINPDGSLGAPASFFQHHGSSIDPARQKEPHAHSINATPDGKFAVAADLGLDQLLVYRLDTATGKMTPNDPPFSPTPAGGGPRHLSFAPNGKVAYLVNEMGCSVTVLSYDADHGTFKELQTITALPAEKSPKYSGAEVQVHPNGKFCYASIRGLDVIAIFTIDPATGKLTPAGHESSGGKTPRNFRIDPTGQYLLAANQTTGNVVVLRIDPATGALTPTGSTIDVASACCIKFLSTPK
jgi:6-phosphogluconolactonase